MGDISYSIKDSKSFEFKTSITGRLEVNNTEKEVEIVVLLKQLSNIWRILDMPLINREINLLLAWSENCVMTSKATRDVDRDSNPAVATVNNPKNAAFKITDTKLHVPVVTLWTKDDNKLLEQLKIGFKRTIEWNKYRSKMSKQTKTNNLSYLIEPTFNKGNRLFVLAFENEYDRTSFSKYYAPRVQIKDFSLLVDGKSFFDVPMKNKEEKYEAIIEIS